MKNRLHRMILELRWPLIVLALAMVLGSAIVIASWYIEDAKNQEFQQVQNRLRAAQLALSNIKREEADFDAYRVRFEGLATQGIFGEEQRLNWVEYMSNLNASGQMSSLTYEIASQRPVSVTAMPQANSIDVLASRIQLKMGFLHEGNLVRTLEAFRHSAAGFYRIEECAVKRKDGVSTVVTNENIVADCKLQWITMRSRSGK